MILFDDGRARSTNSWLDVLDTPQGRAVYPFGAWGAGYLVDAAAERRLRAYLRRMIWIIMAFLVAQSLVHLMFPRLPELVRLAAAYAAFCAFHYVAVKTILRDCARSSVRPSSVELFRLRVARRGHTTMVLGHVFLLIIFAAIAIMMLLVDHGPEQWAVIGGCAAFAIFAVVALVRLRQIPD